MLKYHRCRKDFAYFSPQVSIPQEATSQACLLSRTDQEGGRRGGSNWAETEAQVDLFFLQSCQWQYQLSLSFDCQGDVNNPHTSHKHRSLMVMLKIQRNLCHLKSEGNCVGKGFYPDFFLDVFGFVYVLDIGDKLSSKYEENITISSYLQYSRFMFFFFFALFQCSFIYSIQFSKPQTLKVYAIISKTISECLLCAGHYARTRWKDS